LYAHMNNKRKKKDNDEKKNKVLILHSSKSTLLSLIHRGNQAIHYTSFPSAEIFPFIFT
jgi:hypothetical protein